MGSTFTYLHSWAFGGSKCGSNALIRYRRYSFSATSFCTAKCLYVFILSNISCWISLPWVAKKIQQIQRISAINFLFNHTFKNTSLTSVSRLILQFSFYTLWKYKNTLGFLFSGGGGTGERGRGVDSKRPLTWNGLKGQNL